MSKPLFAYEARIIPATRKIKEGNKSVLIDSTHDSRYKFLPQTDVKDYYENFLKAMLDVDLETVGNLSHDLIEQYLVVILNMFNKENMVKTILETPDMLDNLFEFMVTLIKKLLGEIPLFLKKERKVTIGYRKEIRRYSVAAFGAATNFFGIPEFIAVTTPEKLTPLVKFIKGYWHPKLLGSFHGNQPFQVLTNITVHEDITMYFLNTGDISVLTLLDLAKRCEGILPEAESIFFLLLNLSRFPQVQEELMQAPNPPVADLVVRLINIPPRCRNAVCGIMKNLSFTKKYHDIMINSDQLLPFTIMPIVGPGDYREDELNDIPEVINLELQDPTLERDLDEETRENVLHFLMRLLSTRKGREALRKFNIYCLLREYYTWETNENLLNILGQAINLLIRTEEEIGVDDLSILVDKSTEEEIRGDDQSLLVDESTEEEIRGDDQSLLVDKKTKEEIGEDDQRLLVDKRTEEKIGVDGQSLLVDDKDDTPGQSTTKNEEPSL